MIRDSANAPTMTAVRVKAMNSTLDSSHTTRPSSNSPNPLANSQPLSARGRNTTNDRGKVMSAIAWATASHIATDSQSARRLGLMMSDQVPPDCLSSDCSGVSMSWLELSGSDGGPVRPVGAVGNPADDSRMRL